MNHNINFCFKDCNQKYYRFAKFVIKTNKNKLIEQIMIFQLDDPSSHFTLHNIAKDNKPRRYHRQSIKKLYNVEDRKKIPWVLDWTLPNFHLTDKEYFLQAIPFWRRTENFTPHILVHDEFNPKKNSKLIDFSNLKPAVNEPHIFECYIIKTNNVALLDKINDHYLKSNYIYIDALIDVNPWILFFVK